MKLFGSKNNDEAVNEGLEDDNFDAAFDEGETGGLDMDLDVAEEGGGALSAPSRDFGGGGKSRKGLLLLVLVLLLGAGGGGYYYLAMMGDDTALGAPKAAKMLPKPAANTPAPTVLGANTPPLPALAANNDFAQPAANTDLPDPFAAMDAQEPAPDTDADIASVIDMPGFDTPAAPAAAVTDDPFAAIGDAPSANDTAAAAPAEDFVVVDAPVEVAAEEGATPAEDMAADMPVDMPVDMPADIPGDLPAETVALHAPAAPNAPATEAAPAEAAPGFAEMAARTAGEPVADLPMPDMSDVVAATGADAVPPAMTETANAATPAPAPASAPSEAEKAIVENAAMLDQLSAPAPATASDPAAKGKTATEILGEPAIVRRLPDTYIVVRKDHAAGELDTRLKVARQALMESRFGAAVELFDALAADYPRDERVMMGRALALQQVGRTDEALAAYEVVLSANPKNLEALTNMLGILKASNPALAVEKLEELRSVYPYNADIVAQLGTAHASLKNYDAALQYLEMAEALSPGNAYVYYNKAVLYDRLGQENMASTMYRRILQLHAEGRLTEPLPLEAIRRRLATMR